jgi:hypothetical protein
MNYQTLYQNQQYEELVKATASLSDLNMVRYHIIALLGLGKNQWVLKVMLAKLAMMKTTLPIFLKIHYEILKTDPSFPEHDDLLDAYQQLPYLNQDVEEWVSKIQILRQKPSHHQVKPLPTLILDAWQQGKEDLLTDLIPQCQAIHVFQLKEAFKSMLASKMSQTIKGLIVIAFIQAKYDEMITIYKGEKAIPFNPLDMVNPFATETYKQYQVKINETMKDPSLRQIAYSLLSTYVLKMIPFEIDGDFYFFEAIKFIAYDYLKVKRPDTDFDESEIALLNKKINHIRNILKT